VSLPRLTKLELQIMDALWRLGPISIREIQEAFPDKGRPAYTTVQTTMYRMEKKRVLKRVRKISNAHIFEACLEGESSRLWRIWWSRDGSRPRMYGKRKERCERPRPGRNRNESDSCFGNVVARVE
jgi:hypothetical protein